MWDDLEEKFDKFELKENILTQGESVKHTIKLEKEKVKEVSDRLRQVDNIVLTGAGDKYIIPQAARFALRSISNRIVDVIHSRSLLDDEIKISKNTAIIYLSQSGCTFDTLNAYKKFKDRAATSIWITNLKERKQNSVYEYADKNCIILNTHTVLYPEKPIISTSTYVTTLALLNYLLLTIINTDIANRFKSAIESKLPTLIENLCKNDKLVDWAKNTALNLK
ncbi:MAG: SIS domain-containing protein, partial [Candidatus Odinarchaeia archaeon]